MSYYYSVFVFIWFLYVCAHILFCYSYDCPSIYRSSRRVLVDSISCFDVVDVGRQPFEAR